MKPLELKENHNSRDLYRSIHPGRLVPTASTFAPIPNYGGKSYNLPLVGETKKGFASGKLAYDPFQKKRLFGILIRASST